MTVTSTTQKQIFVGDGANTTFAIPFTFVDDSDVVVYLRDESVSPATETLQTDPTEYSIVSTDVEMVTAPAGTEKLLVKRVKPLTQQTDYINGDSFPAESHEAALDKLTHHSQQQDERLDRVLELPETTALANLKLPEPVAGESIKWNGTANGFEAFTPADGTTLAADIATNASDIDDLETSVDTPTTGLLDRMTAAEAAIVSNDGDISTNATDITTIKGGSSETIASNRSDIDTNTADIAAISIDSAQITTNKNDITAIKGGSSTSIATIDTDQATQDGTLTDHESRINDLENSFGDVVRSASQAIMNNATDVMTFFGTNYDGDGTTSVHINYDIKRRTDDNHVHVTGILYLIYDEELNDWSIEVGHEVGPLGPSGVTFSVTTDGFKVPTVSYTADDLPGASYSAKMRWRAIEFRTVL